jgi:hypothetical protein
VLVDGERLEQPAPLRHVPDAGAGDLVGRAAEDLLALEGDRPRRVGRRDPHDRVAERRLAHAVATDEGDGLVAHLEADVLEHVRAAVVDVEVLDGQQRRAAVRALLARRHRLTSMPSSVTRPPR